MSTYQFSSYQNKYVLAVEINYLLFLMESNHTMYFNGNVMSQESRVTCAFPETILSPVFRLSRWVGWACGSFLQLRTSNPEPKIIDTFVFHTIKFLRGIFQN
ncbi:hypothetical protein [Chryseobacterium defluvii]|uniref:hypothetical protein n=1 Tax=Chryseobacterium defluvii TaxID=160396 RepID=UPI001E5D9DD5|nr:hypothetical protein [Chryseobacterium defluvii]